MENNKRLKLISNLIVGGILIISSFIVLFINDKEDLKLIDTTYMWVFHSLLTLSFILLLLSIVLVFIFKKDDEKINDLVGLVNTLPTAILIVSIVSLFFFNATVEQTSMKKTLLPGDKVLVLKSDCCNRGDIVVSEHNGILLIKRLIAKEGDIVSSDEYGKVTVNGEVVNEGSEESIYSSILNEYTLKENEYFLLGDNRLASLDSRQYGLFDNIKGKVLVILSPFSLDLSNKNN